jgi:adenylate cyclase
MAESRLRPSRPVLAGLLAGLAILLLAQTAPSTWRDGLRERVFDLMLGASAPWRPATPEIRVAFVAIDEASLDAVGPWPWSRETLARLVSAVTAARPAAVAIDILLAGEDERSPAALARRLAEATGRAEIAALAPILADGDRALANAIAAGPVVLGWVLDPRGTDALAPVPVLLREGVSIAALWRENGASGPPPALAAAAAGTGTLSLPGDEDGLVRRVPLFAGAGGEVRPGLALEAARVAAGAPGYLLSAGPPRFTFGAVSRPLPPDGMLRLLPAPAPLPVIPASALLQGTADLAPLAGAVIVIGGSAPELGALRASAQDPLTPSALLQLEALRQLAAGIVPLRPAGAALGEIALALLCVIGAVAVARCLRPATSVLAAAGLVVALILGSALLARADRLVDPTPAVAAALLAFLATSLAGFSETRWREARLRRRFEQHLAPGVVERIVASPDSLRLTGERREVTALFTDIEGFTRTTREAGPEQLVAVLDGYFEGVTRIVGEHGGMVDKLVGDAVHALFNAPLDLEDHPRRALDCAVAILAWTEAYRASGPAAAIGLGRTRQGLETGFAIVGDVGFGAKLDYTAHGEAVNMAARLEALNKELGSSICIGPAAAARCDPARLRRLAEVDLRGIGPVPVFSPA